MLAAPEIHRRPKRPIRAHRRAGAAKCKRNSKPSCKPLSRGFDRVSCIEPRQKQAAFFVTVLVTTDYTFGHDEISQRVVTDDGNGGATDETHVFGHDGHGSVRVLYDLAASAGGLIEQVIT